MVLPVFSGKFFPDFFVQRALQFRDLGFEGRFFRCVFLQSFIDLPIQSLDAFLDYLDVFTKTAVVSFEIFDFRFEVVFSLALAVL